MPTHARPVHWFRIAYARNAFVRSAAQWETLTLAAGIRAMKAFTRDYRPQHGEVDELSARWGPVEAGFEYVIERRMTRHDHPGTTLALGFTFAPRDLPAGSTTEPGSDPAYRSLVRAAVRSVWLEQR